MYGQKDKKDVTAGKYYTYAATVRGSYCKSK